MKGRHRIILETEHLKYDFVIKRNITIILGDSATGKTTLVEYLNSYALRGKASGIKLESDVPCFVYNGGASNWRLILETIEKSIIFIDEGYSFVFTHEFAECVKNSDNYFVLITRQPIYNLPYSTKEIYGIKSSGRFNFPEKVYHEFYPVYPDEDKLVSGNNPVIITEDNKSGYEFLNKTLEGTECISSEGNGNIVRTLSELDKKRIAMIMADGAAFGAYIENVLVIMNIRGYTSIYLPESFEWIVLKSGVLKNKEIAEILDNPEEYIDGKEFFSWESYFTYLLKKCTTDNIAFRYDKEKLSYGYLSEHAKKAILSVFPIEIREMLGINGGD